MGSRTLYQKIGNRLRYYQYPGVMMGLERTHRRQMLYHKLASLYHWRLLRKRNEFIKCLASEVDFEIPKDTGYCVIPPGTIGGSQEAITVVMNLFNEQAVAQAMGTVADGKNKEFYLKLPIDQELFLGSEVFNFFLNTSFIATISSYLEWLPILNGINFWYTPPAQKAELKRSQLFHCDHDDIRLVKIYLFAEDISKESGPLCIIPKNKSLEIRRKMGSSFNIGKRFTDEQMFQYVNPSEVVALTGPKGTITMVDTANCFHYGSRSTGKPRFILGAQYGRLTSANNPLNLKNKTTFSRLINESTDQLTRFVLDAY